MVRTQCLEFYHSKSIHPPNPKQPIVLQSWGMFISRSLQIDYSISNTNTLCGKIGNHLPQGSMNFKRNDLSKLLIMSQDYFQQRKKWLLQSNCLWREGNFVASMRPVTGLCMCVCCIVWACDYIMVIREPQVNIMQHTHMYKAVTGNIEAKMFLSCRRQSDYTNTILVLCVPKLRLQIKIPTL